MVQAVVGAGGEYVRILIIYPGHSISTMDVATGYERALRALGHNVWPFNYHSSLAFYQEAIDYWAERNPGFDPDHGAYLILASERCIIEALDFMPDVVLIVSGMAFHRRAYDLLDRLRFPLALILTESPYLDRSQSLIVKKGHIKVAFTNDKRSVGPLSETGVRIEYLPHSYDPATHYPRNTNGNHDTDVFFHGTLWPEREQLLAPLRDLPHRVRISGIDPSIKSLKDADKVLENMVHNDELADWYCGTKIALNHHRTFVGVEDGQRHIEPGAAHSLGPRAFEIAACGAFQLCDDTRPELAEVFGDTVATYTDERDLRDKIGYYLAHDDEREAMALRSHRRVQGCTFETRARDIVIPTLMEVL